MLAPQFIENRATETYRNHLNDLSEQAKTALHEDTEAVSLRIDPKDQSLIAAEGSESRGNDIYDTRIIVDESQAASVNLGSPGLRPFERTGICD